LLSSDPGDIHDTIRSLVADRIRVSVVGLAAQVAICDELCARTNAGDRSSYAVALHEQHFRELVLAATTPPATTAAPTPAPNGNNNDNADKNNGALTPSNQASLLMMGFPSRSLASKDNLSLCACHNRPTREGYACTRCRTKVCRLPAECPVCGLTLVLSTHLARSYHHLFPLRGWVEVPWSEAVKSKACYACMTPFPEPPAKGQEKNGGAGTGSAAAAAAAAAGGQKPRSGSTHLAVAAAAAEVKPVGVSESGRYACQVCGNHFCIDCDLFAHEVIHNCPGCQSDKRIIARQLAGGGGDGDAMDVVNGGGTGQDGDAMVVDT
jgi:transcription initiation factor TFIIH subunit 2